MKVFKAGEAVEAVEAGEAIYRDNTSKKLA
jgi:hypothetical protein